MIEAKTFAEATMVAALGVTLSGEKHFLGFIETATENEWVLTAHLRPWARYKYWLAMLKVLAARKKTDSWRCARGRR